jgi:hypothetical protein
MKFTINQKNVMNRIYALLKEIDKRELNVDDNLILLHTENLLKGIVKNDK